MSSNERATSGAVPSWSLADRLRKAREHAGLSQEELAEATGISRRTVSAYEQGHAVKIPFLIAWALACNVDLAWLVGVEPGTPINRDSIDYGGSVADFLGLTDDGRPGEPSMKDLRRPHPVRVRRPRAAGRV
jgi:transcriptional regulator with XRE-family HTH domain